MFCPLIPSLVASVIAMACGCKVDEGGAHPCVVFGKDIGYALHIMCCMGLIAIGTFPCGLIALVLFAGFVWLQKRLTNEN